MDVAAAAFQRVQSERRLAAKAALDWRAYIAPCFLLPLAAAYWIMPHDLIPDPTPYIGRLDDCGVIAACLAASRLVMGRLTRDPPARHPRTGAQRIREALLALAAALLGPLLYRLALGQWPSSARLAQFRRGMRQGFAPLSPLLRGIAVMPEGRAQLIRVMELAHPQQRDPGQSLLAPPAPSTRLPMPAHVGTPLRVWTGPRIGFLHFEKAAGTSFLDFFCGLFHFDQIERGPNRAMPPHLLTRLPARTVTPPPALVWGHYDLPGMQRRDPGRLLYTILREPRARLLSLYYYWRAVDPAVLASGQGNHTVCLAHRLDLLSFLRSEDPMLRDYIDNCYVRRLTGRYCTGAPAASWQLTDDALPAAHAGLAAFFQIGICEQLDESLRQLSLYLNLPTPNAAPRVNVTALNERADPHFRRVAREPITPAVAAELDRLTRLDRTLYQTAVARLHAAKTPSSLYAKGR